MSQKQSKKSRGHSSGEKQDGASAERRAPARTGELNVAGAPDTYEALRDAAAKTSILDRVNTVFNDVLENRRGNGRAPNAAHELIELPNATVDDLAIRRARRVRPRQMTVPEGALIDGTISTVAETAIDGRVHGDVQVENNLSLGANALVSGNVRAVRCRVEGLVEGKVECNEDLALGETGRLNAGVMAGKDLFVAGEIRGNVLCGGLVHIAARGRITGDIRARKIVIEDGAVFNGRCVMRNRRETT